ncbi:MAG TPA: efflux transporter outer membrane subunit [Thiobacillaceae bacterium]|nr:efflux transporter outer membrane subunit [Thiobacillaceae bacterium]HNA82758.1 efflux transporter outer membrane subunit [Thiobacillaceae bacterium]HNF89055.1 efflux transporter outer membrane subunit [Thiobacillaceae bacterium]HNH89206.1 efflux transporter outer membrane subunit [Thiobacillaceae bacterium]HNI07403.1 efflux transporter outer membrane subunit [Thiobacillaceae bacterium]
MRPRAPLALATLTMALAGCAALGPDYQRPAATLPGAYSEAGRAEAPAPVERDWWKLFKDPVLDDLMAKALGANLDLQAAVARVEEAEAAAREAGAALTPSVDLDAGAKRIRSSTVTGMPVPKYRSSHTLGLSTAFELDFWGRLRRTKEAARAQALASHHARDTVQLSLAGLVANGYLALRALDAELAVSRESLASRESTLKIVGSRVEAGLASPLDLRQAEGALAAVQAQIAALRQQRAVTEHQLALLTATPDLKIAAGDLRQLPLPPVPPAGLPSSLLESRPDLRQAEEELVANNARIGVAKAALYPTISLTGSLGAESKQLSDLFSGGARTWTLGLGLMQPLFDAGANEARVDQASARQKQSVAAYQKAVQTAFKEVNDALVGLRENGEAETAQEARVAAADQALKLAKDRYEAGYSGYLEVLDAQRTVNDARQAAITTRESRLAAAVDLFKALGGGWKQEPVAK